VEWAWVGFHCKVKRKHVCKKIKEKYVIMNTLDVGEKA